MVVPFMSVRREIVQDMPLFAGSAVSQKTAFYTMREIILFGNFCRVMSSMYFGPVPLPPLSISRFVVRVRRLR